MSKKLFSLLGITILLAILAISFSSAYYGNYGNYYGDSYTYVKEKTVSPWGTDTYISKESPGYSFEYRSSRSYGYNRLNSYWSGPYPNWNHYQYPVYSDKYVRKTYDTNYYNYYYKPSFNSRLGYYDHRYGY